MRQTLDISSATIFRFILIIIGLVFLYMIRDILLMLFLALIIAAAIDGPVDWLAKKKIPRVLGAILIYLIIIALVVLFIYLAFPLLASQTKLLADNFPQYLSRFGPELELIRSKVGSDNVQSILDQISQRLGWAGANVFDAAAGVFGGLFSAIFVFVISIYLVIQDKGIKNFLASVTPAEHQPYVASLAERIQSKLGAWLRGQLFLMLIVGVAAFIGLKLLGVKFALTLAIIAGVLEIVPYLGPVAGAIPAVLLAFLQSPVLALLVAGLFFIIQELEGHLIVPLVMKKALGLNPLIVLVTLIIGEKLGGIMGMVVAVPLMAVISVFLNDLFLRKESR